MVLLEKYITEDISTLPSEGGRFVYDSTTNLVKFRDTVGTATVVSADPTGNVNITSHNGSTIGLQLNSVLITSTATELNLLDGVTATTAELNYVDLTTGPGTAQASKALVLNASSNITTGINSLASSELNVSGHDGSTIGLSLGGTLVTATATELNTMDGITASTAELNLLDGVTATTAELNYVDLTTGPGTAEASKALILNSSSNLTTGINSFASSELNVSGHDGSTIGLSLGGTLITATAAELNTLDGITASTAELNLLDGVTATTAELNYNDLTTGPGTAEASKTLVLDSSSNITGINSLTSSLLVSSSTTATTSNTTGAVLLAGGLAISNTTDASSSANGGTFTTAGGAAIAKSLYVGLNLSVAGDLMVSGTTTTIESVTTVIEDNTLLLNSGPAGSGRDAGFLAQRYQVANDAGTGDVVIDTAKTSFALDDATSTTITLPAGANATNDYYNNWWVKVTSGVGVDNVRQITDYDGTTKVATLASAFTDTPVTADTVNFYNKPYTTFLWQEATNSFVTAFVAADITGALNIIDYADFRCNNLVSASATTTVLNVSGHNGVDAGLSLGGSLVTITAAQLNALAALSIEELSVLDGLTATTAELNYVDLTTGPGTAEPSKALVLNSSGNITTGINTLTATNFYGEISLPEQPLITSVGTLTSLTLSGALTGATTFDASGLVTFTDTTASTSSTIGALKLAGGLSISNTTEAVSSTNGGTFTTAGGMAVAKKLYVGGDFSSAGSAFITGNVGINTSAPTNQLEINSSTGECLRLTYDDSNGSATNYTDLEVDASGILYIKPSSTTAFLEVGDASTNTTLNIFRLSRLTSGTAAANIGVGLSFDLENAAGTSVEGGAVQCVLTSAVDTAENSKLVFNIINAGAVTSRAVLSNTGNFSAVTLSETSDRRVKENIIAIDSLDAYTKINQLEIVDYNFKADADKRVHRGVIAQDLLNVMPNAVYIQDSLDDSEVPDLHTVSSKEILGNLLSAFQHLSQKVEKLEAENESLKQQLLN
jgi:hypothetical protein